MKFRKYSNPNDRNYKKSQFVSFQVILPKFPIMKSITEFAKALKGNNKNETV